MCACVKKSNLNNAAWQKKKKRRPNYRRSTGNAPTSMETTSLFLYDVFFTFLHTIPLRMMNCSQGINQKNVLYSFGNHPLTDSAKTLLSNGDETYVTSSCTDISNYLLSYTYSCAFLIFFVLYVFWWACMVNSRSLLYRGVVWDAPWCCHRLPWSSFPDLTSYFTPSFLLQKLFFFCLQQKPTSYALFLHTLFTSSQPPLPPPCSRMLIELPLVALESHGSFNESAPRCGSSLVTPNISYNQKGPFFGSFQNGRVCLTHPGWSSICQLRVYTLHHVHPSSRT